MAKEAAAAAGAAAAATPAKRTGRSPSPATTRARAKGKTPAKAGRSKSATARTPRTARKTKQEDKAADSASEVGTEDEGGKIEKVVESIRDKAKVAAAEVGMSGLRDDTATKLILRVTYCFLLVAGFMLIVFPQKIKEVKSYKGNEEAFQTSIVRALGLLIFCLALQFISAAQGVATDQKHSLQYGMFTWIGLAAIAVMFLDEIKSPDAVVKKEAQMLVAISVIMLGSSLWACYFN